MIDGDRYIVFMYIYISYIDNIYIYINIWVNKFKSIYIVLNRFLQFLVCGQQALCLDRVGMVQYGMVDACFSGNTDQLGSRCLNIVLLIYIELSWTYWSDIYIYILKIYILYTIYYHMFNWFFLHFILVSPTHIILRSFSGVDPSSSIQLRTLQKFHKNIWINLIISYHSPTWNKVIGDVSSYYLLLTITL